MYDKNSRLRHAMLGASNYVTQSRIHALEISIPEKLSQRYWILYLIHMLALQLEPEKYFVHGLMTVESCNRSDRSKRANIPKRHYLYVP